MRTRLAAAALLGGLGLLTVVLAGCGGGSSSNTGPSSFGGGGGGGGSSGAVVQGQLVNRRTASGESVVVVVLRTALGIGLAEAVDGDLVGGVTVTLTNQNGGSLTTTTAADGTFTFTNVLPGTYTITVEGKTIDPPLEPITVGAGDVANITGTVTEFTFNVPTGVTVVASTTNVEIILQNDAQVAHLLNIAKAAGLVSADPVLQLRLSGWGWGRIAKNFGVHPSVIGLGHGSVSDADVESFRTAHGKGKGNSNGKGKGKKNGQA